MTSDLLTTAATRELSYAKAARKYAALLLAIVNDDFDQINDAALTLARLITGQEGDA